MKLAECDRIYRAAWATHDPDQFSSYCLELLRWYPIYSSTLIRDTFVYWRGRILDAAPWSNLSAMLAPPKHLARAGRLNKEGIPCFYLSGNSHTAVHEIGAVTGQTVQLAAFRIRPEVTAKLILIGEYAHVSKKGFTRVSGDDPNNYITNLINNSELAATFISIDSFFAHVLEDENARQDDYMRTQVLADLLHAHVPDAHGIAFPSVKDTYGQNFGVLGTKSEELFQNVACAIRRVNGQHMYGLNEMGNIRSAVGVSETGDFKWLPESDDDSKYLNFYGLTQEEIEIGARGGNLFRNGQQVR